MNKVDVKRILMSIRTSKNESQVNNLLGKIDLLPEEKLQSMVAQIGNDEESIKKYFEEKLSQRNNEEHQEHTPINKMFTYGIAENCVHLHMPVDLHEMMKEKGIKKTGDIVNLYLLDAIEKIRNLQNDGFYKFVDKDSIYMISPILMGRTIQFLADLDFETHSYKKKELQNEEFVKESPEAQFATKIFGKDCSLGRAKIGFDTINSEEWQTKRKQKIEEFKEQGIILDEEEQEK